VSRLKAEEPVSIASSARERDPDLRLYVVFTDLEATKAAIQTAGQLGRDLNARVVLLVAKVVPYPLPLDSPPVAPEFTDGVFSQLASEQDAEVAVRVYLCRDRDETIRDRLPPGSLVVIGRRAAWWRTSASLLGRRLQRDGHRVVFVTFQGTQPARVAPMKVEASR
jgi:hypothetical protein